MSIRISYKTKLTESLSCAIYKHGYISHDVTTYKPIMIDGKQVTVFLKTLSFEYNNFFRGNCPFYFNTGWRIFNEDSYVEGHSWYRYQRIMNS